MAKAKKVTSKAVAVVVPQKGFTADEYNAVAMSAKLGAIQLLSSKFDVKPEMLALDEKDLTLSYGREVMSCQYSEEAGQAAAIFQYNVVGKAGRKKVFNCVADMFVTYELAEPAPEAAAIGFCRNVGAFAAYPYFRSLVAQLTWAAGLSLPPLPAIASTAHIAKKPKVADEAASVD